MDQSSPSSGRSFQSGGPSGLKFLVLTKCRPWWRFSLNFPPPKRSPMNFTGSSRKAPTSADGSRASPLKRVVPIPGPCTRGDGLQKIPEIGKDLGGKIQEYLAHGKIKDLEAMRKEIPRGLLTMMEVQGLGPQA